MPSFQDSALIFVIALLLFGPKKLPELARQLGKLMGEFRRASNDFRMQMEDELRMSEQAERQKKIEAIEAAAPANTTIDSTTIDHPPIDGPSEEVDYNYPAEEHPHMVAEVAAPEVLPIAESGELKMMPPDTGLPVGFGNGAAAAESHAAQEENSALTPLLDSIPEAGEQHGGEAERHG